MRRLMFLVVPVMFFFTATQASAATIAWNGAGSNDFFDWGAQAALNPEGSFHASPVAVTSNLARTGSIADSSGFTRLVEGTDWFGNFAVGNNVLFTGDTANTPAASSAFTMNFNTAVAGVGAKIQSNRLGGFTARLEVFNGAVSLGVVNIAGTTDGAEDNSAPFLGALSDAVNITKAVYTLTSNTGDGLGINRELTTDTLRQGQPVPEPATIALVSIGALGAAIRRRRRQ
jgi:PEP-CTERM motif